MPELSISEPNERVVLHPQFTPFTCDSGEWAGLVKVELCSAHPLISDIMEKILKAFALIMVGRVNHFIHHLATSHTSCVSNQIMQEHLYLRPGSSRLQKRQQSRAFLSSPCSRFCIPSFTFSSH